MESKFKYQLTQKAEMDLSDIIEYIVVRLSNPKAATDFIDKIQDAIEEARLFPQSGLTVVNEFLSNQDIRKKLVDNYIMYYLPDFSEKNIIVLRIVHGRQNMDDILRKLDMKN